MQKCKLIYLHLLNILCFIYVIVIIPIQVLKPAVIELAILPLVYLLSHIPATAVASLS